jgi:hypothetical protein
VGKRIPSPRGEAALSGPPLLLLAALLLLAEPVRGRFSS